MGKTYRFCNLTENERVSLKKSLPYLKCMFLRLSCVVHGSIWGRFMGFNLTGFLSILIFGAWASCG